MFKNINLILKSQVRLKINFKVDVQNKPNKSPVLRNNWSHQFRCTSGSMLWQAGSAKNVVPQTPQILETAWWHNSSLNVDMKHKSKFFLILL